MILAEDQMELKVKPKSQSHLRRANLGLAFWLVAALAPNPTANPYVDWLRATGQLAGAILLYWPLLQFRHLSLGPTFLVVVPFIAALTTVLERRGHFILMVVVGTAVMLAPLLLWSLARKGRLP